MPESALTELLASYVPRLIQKRVAQNPTPIESPLAQDFHAALLFADISGFTALTERLAERGTAGVEVLARILNDYFGQLIDLVHEYGGDVVKFGGDAIIVAWPIAEPGSDAASDEPGSVSRVAWREQTLRAAACAFQIRARLLNYQAEGSTLSLKFSLGTGQVWESHIGGIFNRWEFVLVGEPLSEIGAANHFARAGDVIASPSAWGLIEEECDGEPFRFELEPGGEARTAARLQGLKTGAADVPVSREERLSFHETAQAALRPYIPGAIIHRISAGQADWLAELRKVTILFINLPELNHNTSLETAQELMRLIQQCIYRYEGSLNKISQDDKGVMIDVAFGLPPLAHADDPLRGIQAAFLIRDELRARGVRGAIGLTTGRVFCGLIGTDRRREYTFIGNPVNLAGRLMSLALQQNEIMRHDGIAILCDSPTSEAARGRVEFKPLPPQRVKGRSEPVAVYNPLHETKSVVPAQTELIGRREEKSLLVSAVQELQRGRPFQVVILHGEPGIGKSRLMDELIRQAVASEMRVYSGAADAMERNNPYFAWRSVFSRIFGLEDFVSKPQLGEEDRPQILEKVITRLVAIDTEFARYAPLLSVVLPISFPENNFTLSMSGEVRGGNIRELLVRLLQQEADQAPILVTLEDLHWMDSASWILLADVAQRVRPMLLAVDTRPFSPPVPAQFKELAERADTTFIRLDMMPLSDVDELVRQRLGIRSMPPQAARLIRRKSEGHPFFAEELAYSLRDSGVLLIEGDECRLAPGLTDLSAVTLPDNLEAAITSRIDALNPSQQLTLKVASVIGRIFAYRILEAIHPIETDKPGLHSHLDALTRLSLTLVESETPELAYIFKHAITQETAYNLMLFAQRRHLHRAVGEWLEQHHQQDLDSFYTLLAYHWQQAASPRDSTTDQLVISKAREFLEKAGDQSLNNFANSEALEFLTRLLELTDPARVSRLYLGRLYRKLGDACLGLGRLADAKEYIVKGMGTLGLPLPASNSGMIRGILTHVVRQTGHRLRPGRSAAQKLDPEEEEAHLEIVILTEKLAITQYLIGDPNPLPMLFGVLAGLNTGETIEPTPEVWSLYATMSAVAGYIPLPSQAQYYKERWLALGQQLDDPNAYVDGASSLCTVASGNGAWQEVRDLIAKSSAICEELGDHRRGAEAASYLSVNALLEGGPRLTEAYNRRLWEIAMRRENPIHIAMAYQVDCSAMVWAGKYDECIENARKCIALSERSWVGDIPEYIVRSAMWLAMWHKGQREEAWEPVKAALDKFAKSSVFDFSAHLIDAHLAEVVFLALEQGKTAGWPKERMDEIEKYARVAIKNLKKFAGVFPIAGPALNRFRGDLEWYRGRRERAYQSWRTAAQKAHVFPMKYEEARAHFELGRRLPEGNPERAASFETACALFAECGLENWVTVVRQAQHDR